MQKVSSRATYNAIAERAGVSKTTVSLVLRGLARDRIPTETYARVEMASRELGYYPNRLVRSLQQGRTETLAVIAPKLWMEHAGRILDGIREEAARNGYLVLLGSASECAEDERTSAENLLQHRADGLIRFSSVADQGGVPEWLREAVQRGIPCVIIDDVSLEGQVDCVVSDDMDGAYQAVRHLIETGRRRIVHFSGDAGRTSADERSAGYRRALREFHLPYERIIGHSYSGHGADDLLKELFEERDPPDALFCCNDGIAVQAQRYVRAKDLRVPEDVAIIGFSGSSLASEARITSVEQPLAMMGRHAVDRLLARIGGDITPFEVHRLPTKVIVRESTASGFSADQA